MAPVKAFLDKVFTKNEYLKALIENIKSEGLRELLAGDNLHNAIHHIAAMLVAVKTATGMSTDKMAEEASEWLDKKIPLPMPAELMDGIIFKAFIKAAIKYIEKEGSEDMATQGLIADALAAIKAGDVEIV